MKVTVRKDRNLIIVNARNTQNENDVETIEITVPEEYEDFNKKIVFITDDGVVWDFIENNKYTLTKAITKYKKVKFYIWLTQNNKDFRSEERTIVFNKNQDANEEVTEEEISGFNKMINILEEEITEVTGLQEDLTNLINTVQTKLDNGDFVGPQGPQGEPGESYDDTEIKEEIADIKEEQTTQNTRIEELEEQVQELENNQLTGTATGQSIYIEDSTNTKVRSIRLSGNSEQNVTNNLLNLTTVGPDIITYNEKKPTLSNGIINVKGKNDETINAKGRYQNGYVYIYTTQNWKPNTTYYISCKIQVVSNVKNLDSTYFSCGLYGGKFADIRYNSTTGRYEGYITSPETISDTDTVKTLLELRLDGMELNISEISLKTTQDYTFNGYGISPSPEVSSEIHSTGDSGSVNEKVQNKNFLGLQDIAQTTALGLTYSVKNGKITINGTASSGGIIIPLKSPINCKNGTNYVLSKVTSGTSSNNNFNIQLRSNGASIKNPTAQSLPVIYNDLSDTIDAIRLYVGNGYVFTNYTLEMQLEQGTTATNYAPHEEQDISFPLSSGQKLMQGDYLADDGIHHVRGEVDLKDLTWTYTSDGNRFLCNNVSNLNIKGGVSDSQLSTQILSNIFRVYSNNWIGSNNFHEPGIAITTTGLIRAKYTDTTDVNTFVTMLTNTNAILQYELAEEVIEAYTEEQQAVWEQIKALRTYKPVTHISSTDEVPATVDVTYVKDLETVINNLGGA